MASLNQHLYAGPVRFIVSDQRPKHDFFAIEIHGAGGAGRPGDLHIAGLTWEELIQLRDELASALLTRANGESLSGKMGGYSPGVEPNTLVAPDGTVLREVG